MAESFCGFCSVYCVGDPQLSFEGSGVKMILS